MAKQALSLRELVSCITRERLVSRGRKLSKSRKVVSRPPGFRDTPVRPACSGGRTRAPESVRLKARLSYWAFPHSGVTHLLHFGRIVRAGGCIDRLHERSASSSGDSDLCRWPDLPRCGGLSILLQEEHPPNAGGRNDRCKLESLPWTPGRGQSTATGVLERVLKWQKPADRSTRAVTRSPTASTPPALAPQLHPAAVLARSRHRRRR